MFPCALVTCTDRAKCQLRAKSEKTLQKHQWTCHVGHQNAIDKVKQESPRGTQTRPDLPARIGAKSTCRTFVFCALNPKCSKSDRSASKHVNVNSWAPSRAGYAWERHSSTPSLQAYPSPNCSKVAAILQGLSLVDIGQAFPKVKLCLIFAVDAVNLYQCCVVVLRPLAPARKTT